MPAALLERAIAQHVVKSPYLPKASDLIAIAKGFLTDGGGSHGPKGESMGQRGNRMMDDKASARMFWVDDVDGGAHLEMMPGSRW